MFFHIGWIERSAAFDASGGPRKRLRDGRRYHCMTGWWMQRSVVPMKSMICFLTTLVLFFANAVRGEGEYKFIKEIPIGGEGGWDILTVDSAARRLYLSHATKVVVVDLEKNSVAGEISDTPGVHGFVVAPEQQRGFSTNGKEAKVSVVDLKDAQDDLKGGDRRKSRRVGLRTAAW